MLLTIQNERLGHLEETLTHQCFFHLVLDVLHLDVVVHVQVTENLRDCSQVSRFVDTLERLDDGVHDFV